MFVILKTKLAKRKTFNKRSSPRDVIGFDILQYYTLISDFHFDNKNAPHMKLRW